MRKFFGLAIVLVFLTGYKLFSVNLVPGSQYYYTGYGVKEIALGYTGISELGSIDGSSFNPAGPANIRRIANSFTVGGFGSENYLFSLGIAYPSDFGVLTVSGLYLSGASNALNSLLGFQIGISKPITENLFWGFDLKYANGSSSGQSDWQLACDMGLILSYQSEQTGIGFLDPSYGLVLKNLGKSIQASSYDAFPAMGVGAGVSFFPLKWDVYKLKFLGDITFPFNPFNICINLGIENILFDFIKIRAGYPLSTKDYGVTSVGPNFGVSLSGRIGFNPTNFTPESLNVKSSGSKKDNSTEIELSYALQMQKFNGKDEIAHFINLSVAWGYYDDKKPDIDIKPDSAYFSPNFDGIQDEVKLKLNVRDNTLVDGWEVKIMDKNKKVVKTIKSIDKPELRTLTLEKAINQIFSKKQQVEIPEEISWNGQDENGVKLPDGEYTYVLRAWDENKNVAETVPQVIIIDTVVPKMDVLLQSIIFSPNQDGAKDELIINLKTSDIQTGDQLKVWVSDSSGRVVRSYEYDTSLPDKIIWDGKDDKGNPVPEGQYSIKAGVYDRAGNKTEREIQNIVLVTTYQKTDLDINLNAFSPNNDGIKDAISFTPKVSDEKGLERWSLKIYDSRSNVVKEFKGEKSLPKEISWDGKDNNGKILQDGNYSYDLQLFFDSGNHPSTERKTVKLRNTPPKVSIAPEYLSFSPNNDGKQDTISFDLKAIGEDGDQIEVKILDSSGNPVYYNQYDKKDLPGKFVWNGLDKDLKPLPEGKYSFVVECTDNVGNKSITKVENILLKTGLEKVAVQSDIPAISPNNPSANSKANFTPSVTSKEGIVEFSFEIRDGQNNIVKSYKSDKFVERIEWDGKDNSGKILKDGIYTYQLRVKYNYGDEPVSTPKVIKVDSTPPEITVDLQDKIFSPNGDGSKDNLAIKQGTKGENNDVYEAAFKDSSGKAVKTYSWTGNIPEELVWDGKDDKGNPAPEGIYTYEINGQDIAKNKTSKRIEGIKLIRALEKLTFESDVKAFSPNGDGNLDTMRFKISLSSTNDLADSTLTIYDSIKNPVRKFYTKGGVQNEIIWDGRNDSKNILPDGFYIAQMECNFLSGNKISSIITNILLKKEPPSYKLNISPAVFTPDSDGEDDTLYINLEVSDVSGIKDWELGIYKKIGENNYGPLFKKFSGKGEVKQLIQWDGYSDDKQDLVESVQDYTVMLGAENGVGNKLTNVKKDFTVGVLVEKTPDGLRIRVSSIQFAFDRADLTGDGKKNLDKVIYIIRKILSDPKKYGLSENYRIEVSGHTDDVGTDEYNQKLSERRAQTVYKYLIENDIDPKILTYVGYGESRPYKIITTDMTKEKREDYRARNRRVEFFIHK